MWLLRVLKGELLFGMERVVGEERMGWRHIGMILVCRWVILLTQRVGMVAGHVGLTVQQQRRRMAGWTGRTGGRHDTASALTLALALVLRLAVGGGGVERVVELV